MSDQVRVSGDSTQRFEIDGEIDSQGKPHQFLSWRVEVLDDDGKWQLVTACIGASARRSAELIADDWRKDVAEHRSKEQK